MDRPLPHRIIARRRGLPWLVVALGALLPAPVAAQVDIEVGGSREVLSGDHEPWEDYWIRATIRPAPGTFAYGGLRHTRRFGHEDQQFEVGGGLPLAPRWSLRLDGTWSPTRRVMPNWGAAGTVTHRIAPRWSVYGGGGRQVWDVTGVTRQHAGVDHFIGRVRVGYRLDLHQIDVGGSGARHGVHGSWRYDGRGSHLNLGASTGRGAALVDAVEIVSIPVHSASVSGTHWLDDHTGIGFRFGVVQEGDAFTRTISSVGVRRRL